MLGYTAQDDITPWGHIAADGTIANMESMWYVYLCMITSQCELTNCGNLTRAGKALHCP